MIVKNIKGKISNGVVTIPGALLVEHPESFTFRIDGDNRAGGNAFVRGDWDFAADPPPAPDRAGLYVQKGANMEGWSFALYWRSPSGKWWVEENNTFRPIAASDLPTNLVRLVVEDTF